MTITFKIKSLGQTVIMIGKNSWTACKYYACVVLPKLQKLAEKVYTELQLN